MKPILFNTEMVRAILDGRKTVTRRIVKLPKHIKKQEDEYYTLFADGHRYEDYCFAQVKDYINPPHKIGDMLYVRETFFPDYDEDGNAKSFYYKTDYNKEHQQEMRWKPSIHMPKDAARIFLKVTGVRIERVQNINEDSAVTEGFSPVSWLSARDLFANTWQYIYLNWDANPWVWVIEFERCDGKEVIG